jgi:transketolase C-terminal domain/subunit
MIGIAAGLTIGGKIPFTGTLPTSLEYIPNSSISSLPEKNVKSVHAGLT